MKKALFICEECQAVFDRDVRKDKDGKCGHICRAKKNRSGYRCESYLDKYVRRREMKKALEDKQ
jgi:hypothetical protein